MKSNVVIKTLFMLSMIFVQPAHSDNNEKDYKWEKFDDTILSLLTDKGISGSIEWAEDGDHRDINMRKGSSLTFDGVVYDKLFKYDELNNQDIFYFTDGEKRYDSVLKIVLNELEGKSHVKEEHTLDNILLTTYSWGRKCHEYKRNGECKEYSEKYEETITGENELYNVKNTTPILSAGIQPQSVSVPEPNSLYLLMIGFIALLAYKRNIAL